MCAIPYQRMLQAILREDTLRWSILECVHALDLPDCWIGAGFVRNATWDHLHGRPPRPPSGDVDVVWHDPGRMDPAEDARLEARLRAMVPAVEWSVKNQARMHRRNGDAPYGGTVEAMRHWPETATAVAARRTDQGGCEIAAPFGLDDLFNLVLRPTPRFEGGKRPIYLDRVEVKGWLRSWPLLWLG